MLHDTTPGAKESGLSAPWLPGVVAWKLGTCFIFGCAIIISLVPCSFVIDGNSFDVARNQAIANPAVVSGASEFLSAAAAGAGLTESEFVTTVVGISTVGYGASFANSAGINYGRSLSSNLSSLVDAADYPDYDSLDNSTKEAWGSREYYETAKFNALCDAFGMGDARQRFYSSGGSGVDFTSEELGILGHIGAIGETWIKRGGALFEDIRGLFTADTEEVLSNYYAQPYGEYTAPDDLTDWPLPFRDLKLGMGNLYTYRPSSVSGYINFATSSDCIFCICTAAKGSNAFVYVASKTPFMAADNIRTETIPTPNREAASRSIGDFTYYGTYTVYGGTWPELNLHSNMPVNLYTNSNWSNENMMTALGYVLMQGYSQHGGVVPIEGYPEEQEDIPDTQPVYIPDDGVQPNNTWNYYITAPEQPPAPVVRPDNPYNPDNQSGTQEWRDETTENLQPLLNLHVEKLFPFCLYWDMKELWTKVVAITGMEVSENGNGMLHVQSEEDYNHIAIPIVAGDINEEIYFNLEPLHDIGVMVRPFALVTLIILELTSVLWFWKGILTGS